MSVLVFPESCNKQLQLWGEDLTLQVSVCYEDEFRLINSYLSHNRMLFEDIEIKRLTLALLAHMGLKSRTKN